VEYRGSGSTHKAILNLLKGYESFSKVHKNHDDGAIEVARGIQRNNFPYSHLRICGVNTDCCVLATVMGMVKLEIFKNSKIEMVKSACEWSKHGKYDWRKFHRHKNIMLAA
jgi:nicotinamidase-related amidase